MTDPEAVALQAAAAIRERTGVDRHDVAVILGSGWAPAAAELGAPTAVVPVAELPGFTPPTAEGHGGDVMSVRTGDHRVLVFVGRIHAYEGHDLRHVVHPVRAACAAGVQTVVLTNAAGGLRADFAVGQPVLISDHLNLTATSPLVGAAVRRPGRRVFAAAAGAGARGRTRSRRGGLRLPAGAALRNPRRDQDAAHAWRGSGRHVDGARDDRRESRGRTGARGVAGDEPGGGHHRDNR